MRLRDLILAYTLFPLKFLRTYMQVPHVKRKKEMENAYVGIDLDEVLIYSFKIHISLKNIVYIGTIVSENMLIFKKMEQCYWKNLYGR